MDQQMRDAVKAINDGITKLNGGAIMWGVLGANEADIVDKALYAHILILGGIVTAQQRLIMRLVEEIKLTDTTGYYDTVL